MVEWSKFGSWGNLSSKPAESWCGACTPERMRHECCPGNNFGAAALCSLLAACLAIARGAIDSAERRYTDWIVALSFFWFAIILALVVSVRLMSQVRARVCVRDCCL